MVTGAVRMNDSALRDKPLAPAVVPGERIASIDVIRGAIMVVMAIDHVRVYSGVPAGGPSAGVFFTRWVTHFCAPGFVSSASRLVYARWCVSSGTVCDGALCLDAAGAALEPRIALHRLGARRRHLVSAVSLVRAGEGASAA